MLRFPSYGEVADLGGPGPSLGRLYAEGNAYIRANASWASMAATTRVSVVAAPPAQADEGEAHSGVDASSPDGGDAALVQPVAARIRPLSAV